MTNNQPDEQGQPTYLDACLGMYEPDGLAYYLNGGPLQVKRKVFSCALSELPATSGQQAVMRAVRLLQAPWLLTAGIFGIEFRLTDHRRLTFYGTPTTDIAPEPRRLWLRVGEQDTKLELVELAEYHVSEAEDYVTLTKR